MRSKFVVSLWILAVVLPLVCVVAGAWVFWNLTARPGRFLSEPGITVVQAGIVAMPFVVLAAIAPSKLRTNAGTAPRALAAAAATGLVVTGAVWAMYYYDGYIFWKTDGRNGANIGAGVFMLGSPFLAGVLMGIAFRLSGRK